MKILTPIVAGITMLSASVLSSVAFGNSLAADISKTHRSAMPPIVRIVPYTDEGYGFKLAVPENWTQVYAAEDDQDEDALEPGYAVAFESPRSGSNDHFADYLMIEILPGGASGAFEGDGNKRQAVMVDGRMAITDTIYLDGFDINGASLDLVVYQAEIVELGFTMTVFAIGEAHEAAVMADAFELALKTLKVPEDPFSVS